MNKETLVHIEIHFINGGLHDTITDPIEACRLDGCYVVDTKDNKTKVYPFTSIKKITEKYEEIQIKPEDLEYGKA